MQNEELDNTGVIEVVSKKEITEENIAKVYTPGVAELVKKVDQDPESAYKHTWKGRTVVIVSDGTAILGLGDRGAKAALPVMEAKAALFKSLGGVDAVPIVLDTKDPKEIISIVKAISPGFGGINLEDISAPRCFEISKALERELDIPVFHDDQYGTAIAVLAGLFNAVKVAKKEFSDLKIVLSGAGAAGFAIADLLLQAGIKDIIIFDSKGALHKQREDVKDISKLEMIERTNKSDFAGNLSDSLKDADVFIGVSVKDLLQKDDLEKMNENAIVFALANPVPEIMPGRAKEAKNLAVIATGRSDFPNQINNALVFPGLFRGALETRTVEISNKLKIEISKALASLVETPNKEQIIPQLMDKRVVDTIVRVFQNVQKS